MKPPKQRQLRDITGPLLDWMELLRGKRWFTLLAALALAWLAAWSLLDLLG